MPMVTYPLNNIEYTAEDAELFHSTRTSGVYAINSFDYSASGADNTIVIGPGIAWIKNSEFSGKVVAQKEPISINVGLSDPNYERIDAVAIQFDANKNASEIVVKNGVPGSRPTAPSIVRTEGIYELHLYHVRRNAGSLTISENNITDLRSNNNYCGLMTDSVTQAVDTTFSKNGVAADSAAVGIALDGKAPAGFGLGSGTGTFQQLATPSDVDSCKNAGWYEYYSSTQLNGAGTQYGGILVIPSMWSVTQMFFCRQHYGCYMKRIYQEGSWSPWEWVNPPMVIGTEYRTTERHAGKSVFMKTVSLGSLPNNTYKTVSHGISNIEKMLAVGGTAKNGNFTVNIPASSGALTLSWAIGATETSIIVNTHTDRTAWTGEAWVKYTKVG